MKKIVIILLCLIAVGCIAAFFCRSESFVKDTDAKPDIKVSHGVFDITPDDCIAILNEDLKQSGLPQISEEYKTWTADAQVENGEGKQMSQTGVTYYDASISDTIKLRMVSFQSLDNGIPVIELIETRDKVNTEKSLLHSYFQVAAENIVPRLNVDKFRISVFQNKSTEVDDLLVWCGSFNNGDDGEKNVYLITTNQDLFDFYL